MKVLLVHAHPEPLSFNAALKDAAVCPPPWNTNTSGAAMAGL